MPKLRRYMEAEEVVRGVPFLSEIFELLYRKIKWLSKGS